MTETAPAETQQHHYWPHFLLVAYAIIWTFLAIDPLYRHDWALENILIVVGVAALVWSYYKLRLSNLSYTCIFVFMVLHTIGAHYTYAEVPFGFWLSDLLGLARNHFDRIVHFSFGLLLAYPVRELFLRVASTRGVWGYWLPVELTLALSALYEIMEWVTVLLVNPTAGSAFLGTQGDEFDAIKDMALAGVGACIAMFVALAVRWHYDRRLGRELKASVTVKPSEPLGEVALSKLEAAVKAEEAAEKPITPPKAPRSRKRPLRRKRQRRS